MPSSYSHLQSTNNARHLLAVVFIVKYVACPCPVLKRSILRPITQTDTLRVIHEHCNSKRHSNSTAVHVGLQLLGRVALGAQRPIDVKLSRGWSVGRCVGLCTAVHCGKTADRIRMPFGIISQTGPGMRHILWFGDRSTGRGTFGGEFGARHCNQWGLNFATTRPSSQITLADLFFWQQNRPGPAKPEPRPVHYICCPCQK